MDIYQASARKFRPDSFETVVGQESITQTLKNIVINKQISQAYLFCGPRGVGKTTCARIFAKTINCTNLSSDGEACNECQSCKSFIQNRSMNIFECDAASKNSVENIKDLINQVRIPPSAGSYSVFIIDEVHMLSTNAFNAFLKTLEEPPPYAVFILATTEKYKILPTILSRCQTYDFNRISISEIINRLKFVAESEKISYEENALYAIAQKADGGMRDALSIFDQIASFSNRNITYKDTTNNLNIIEYELFFKITDFLLEGNYQESLIILNDVIKNGFEANYFVNGLASHYRNILICKAPNTVELLEIDKGAKENFIKHAKKCPTEFLFYAIDILCKCDLEYKQSLNKRLLVELALLKLSNIYPSFKKINKLEPKAIEKNDFSILKDLEKNTIQESEIKNLQVRRLEETKWIDFLNNEDLGNKRLNQYLASHFPEIINKDEYYIKVETTAIKDRLELFLPKINEYFKKYYNNINFVISAGLEPKTKEEINKNIEEQIENGDEKKNKETTIKDFFKKNPLFEKFYLENNFERE